MVGVGQEVQRWIVQLLFRHEDGRDPGRGRGVSKYIDWVTWPLMYSLVVDGIHKTVHDRKGHPVVGQNVQGSLARHPRVGTVEVDLVLVLVRLLLLLLLLVGSCLHIHVE